MLLKPVIENVMKKLIVAAVCVVSLLGPVRGQDVSEDDALFLRSIYDKALTESACYDHLTYLSEVIGGRLAGSPQAAAAVEYTRQIMEEIGMDSVWLQPCMVPHWVRGAAEEARIVNSSKMGTVELSVTALGNSVGTDPGGLTAEVVEVKSLDEVDRLGENLRGKIVFFNRPMDPRHVRTFHAYGGAVDQRGSGPARAARYGAVAAIVRSMTPGIDDIPHTGVTIYEEGGAKIPAVAVSTHDAEILSTVLSEEPVRVYLKTDCKMLEPVLSYNVIGEIRGSDYPEEIILVGGHLDSWDIGGGAHDDGAGCVHSLEVIRLFNLIGYRPKRTIRCVMFMNEENGLAGGVAYADSSNARGEYHLAAIESDAGGFSPRAFSLDGHEETIGGYARRAAEWLPLLEPYGITFTTGGSGADISPLKSQKGLLLGLRPDSQRYFDYHHTAVDRIDAVSKRELELGAAAMAAMVYLIDKYGLQAD